MTRQLSDFFGKEYLEFTLQIGCRINCMKYCPQEQFLQGYKGIERTLTIENFGKMLDHVPLGVPIVFGGFSEPFQNEDCTNMICMAHDRGYKIGLFTTLFGLSMGDALTLKAIPFEMIYLHLPDSYGNAKIPITQTYRAVLPFILTSHEYVTLTSMNGFFQTNNRENLARSIGLKRKWYPINCIKHQNNQFTVLPNGDVYSCCMDMRLDYRIGNLLKQPYSEIQKEPWQEKELCRYCDQSTFELLDLMYRLKMKIHPGKLIGV